VEKQFFLFLAHFILLYTRYFFILCPNVYDTIIEHKNIELGTLPKIINIQKKFKLI